MHGKKGVAISTCRSVDPFVTVGFVTLRFYCNYFDEERLKNYKFVLHDLIEHKTFYNIKILLNVGMEKAQKKEH